MLSTKEIKKREASWPLFLEQDNYYSREEGKAQSQWWGKGAEKLELIGCHNINQAITLGMVA